MKKLFIFLLLGMFMMSLVSAMEIDNKMSYDLETDTITFTNAFGFGSDLAKAKLQENGCDEQGRYCQAIKTITLYEEGELIQDFKTLRVDDDSWTEQNIRGHRLEYWGDINDYERKCNIEEIILANGTTYNNVCNNVLIGSHEDWITFKEGDIFKEGEYLVKTSGEIKPGRIYDWQVKIQGDWTTPWATWGNITLGDEAEVLLNSPDNNSILYIQPQTFNCSANITGGASLVNMSLWTNITGTFENTNSTDFSSQTPINGTGHYDGYTDEIKSQLDIYYRLNDTSGAVIDATGNNSGTTTNSPTYNVSGKVSGGMHFEKVSDQYISSDSNTGITGADSWSMNSWINVESQDATNPNAFTTIGTSGGGSKHIVSLQVDTSASANELKWVEFGPGACENEDIASGVTLIGEWHMITATYDGSNCRMYVDGVNVYNNTGTLILDNDVFRVGHSAAGSQKFDGIIDEVGVWSRALTTDEIADIYSPSGTTSSTQIYKKTISGSTLWTCQACDSDGDCGYATSNRTLFLDTILPQIIIESPVGTLDYSYVGNNETLNVTFTDIGLSSCWYNYNGTNITIDGCLTGIKNSTNFILENGNKNMTIYANDTIGNLNSTLIEWNYTYFENNRTHNITSSETATELFSINIDGATTASLFYNGTEYTTTKSGNNFQTTIQVPINQLGNRPLYWRFDDTQNSHTSFQNVSSTIFGLCNTTLTTTFLNISFKDEADSSFLNASIPTSTFEYYLGDGTLTKSLTYINNTDNYNYLFCASLNKTFNVDYRIQYKQGTTYPQRVVDPPVLQFTNTTTNQTLYLLSTADGIFVTFQVINIAEQAIPGVLVTASRIIESENTIVGIGTTGDTGLATLWLNPDFEHTFTFNKTGIEGLSSTFAPTQSAYTVTLGSTTTTPPSDLYQGISKSIAPLNTTLVNGTDYNFDFVLSSTFWEVSEFGFILINSSGDTVTSASLLTSGGNASVLFNTGNNSQLMMKYFWVINNTYTNGTSIVWYVTSTELSQFSLSKFFTDLTLYINSGLFGLDNFGFSIILFIFIFVTTGIVSLKFGLDSPAAISVFVFTFILFLDVGLGLMNNINPVGAIPHFITVFTGIVTAGLLFRRIHA